MLRRIALLAAVVLVASCGGREAPPPRRPPNVLLISVDTLRADHLSCYGYSRSTTPFLDRLAASGVRFADASVETHGTPPSHTTMLTGLDQETHRVGYQTAPDEAGSEGIPKSARLVSELFHEHGYRTIGVTGGGHVSGTYGFSRGFDDWNDAGGGIAAETSRMADLIAAAPRDRPLFLFLHTYEVHSPYHPPEKYRELFGPFASDFDPSSENLLAHAWNAAYTLRPEDVDLIRARYDQELRYTDDTLAEFFRRLRALGALDDALVVVTGDHGEEFAEHGGLTHRDTLYQELVHVPLVVVGSGAVDLGPPRVEPALVSLLSIAPTLLSVAGIAPPAAMEGPVILPEVAGPKNGPIFAQYGGRRFLVREGSLVLIETRSPKFWFELYDLETDPGEHENLAEKRPDDVRRLVGVLHRWIKSRHPIDGGAPAVTISPEEREKLKSLGYLGGS